MQRTKKDWCDPNTGKSLFKGVTFEDWKARPDEVLEAVDKQLKAFGLEVVMHDDGSDSYVWRIVPRVGKKNRK